VKNATFLSHSLWGLSGLTGAAGEDFALLGSWKNKNCVFFFFEALCDISWRKVE
jgi:hypothetical protein